MASKQDVQLSINGEPASTNTTQQEISNIALQDRVVAESDFVLFKLVDTSRNGRVYIDGIADMVHPDTGKVERARLIVGAESIWQKDQKDMDKDFVKQNRVSLEFVGKVCRVFKWEENKLLFARLNPNNIGSPSKKTGSRLEYFEYNPKKQQEESLKKQTAKIELVLKIRDMAAEPMKKLAIFLGIGMVDELGQLKTDNGLRTELMIKADNMPDVVSKYVDSKEVEISYLVRKAILNSRIELGGSTGNVNWSNGGNICKMPQSRNALEYLTELAMTNSADGKQFLEQLKNTIT